MCVIAQISKARTDVSVAERDLLAVPKGPRTEACLRNNCVVGVQYLEAWLGGLGCVPLYNLMEDAATAEICRTQVPPHLFSVSLALYFLLAALCTIQSTCSYIRYLLVEKISRDCPRQLRIFRGFRGSDASATPRKARSLSACRLTGLGGMKGIDWSTWVTRGINPPGWRFLPPGIWWQPFSLLHAFMSSDSEQMKCMSSSVRQRLLSAPLVVVIGA